MKIRLTLVLAANVVLTVALFPAPARLFAQSATSCGCQDKGDLINRLVMANAAYEKALELSQILRPPSEMSSTSPELRAGVAKAIRDAASLVEDKQANSASAETDLSTCETKIEAGTPCLKSLLWNRERIHRDKCIGLKGIGKPLTFRVYLENVLAAYKQEITEVRSRLLAMPPSCRPAEWIGTITVTETKKMVITNTIPGTSRFDHGAVETMDHETTRTGVIRFDGKTAPYAPPSTWQVTSTLIKTWVHNSTVDCDTTPLKEELVSAKSETRTEIIHSGSSSISLPVDAYAATVPRMALEIRLQLPTFDLSGTETTINTTTGGCPGMARSDHESGPSTGSVLSPEDVKIELPISEPFERDRLKLHRVSGSDVYYPRPITYRDPPGITSKHEIRVTVNLYAIAEGRWPL